MKIIVQGNHDLIKKIKKFSCNSCGCIFEANNSEYKYGGSQYNVSYYECRCPCCDAKAYSVEG